MRVWAYVDFGSGKSAMINRRRALQSCLSFAAATAASRTGILFGRLPGTFAAASAANESRLTLAEMLREAIELCRRKKSLPRESRRLCEVALVRVQRSDDISPAFWQACADSVARLEVAVSGCEHASSWEECSTAAAMYQLRSLRQHLVNQTVRVIGGLGRRAYC